MLAMLMVITTVFGTTGNAQIVSTMGGDTVPLNTRMLDVATGYPSAVFVRYHIPILNKLELAPLFTFDYGFDTWVPSVSDRLGLSIKYKLFEKGKFKLSLLAEPGIRLGYYGRIRKGVTTTVPWVGTISVAGFESRAGFNFAIDLRLPEVMMSYLVIDKLAIDFGLKIPIAIFVYPDVVASIPILFNAGVEYNIINNMNLLFSTDLGPDILAASGYHDVEFRVNVRMGVAFRF